MADESNFRYVRFDVGGQLFSTSKQTLNKFPGTILAECVSPESDTRENENDIIPIDRDGKHFGAILNYMRDEGSLNLSRWSVNEIKELEREAHYYGLDGLVEICRKNIRQTQIDDENIILTITSLDTLKNKLKNSDRPSFVFPMRFIQHYRMELSDWMDRVIPLCDFNKYNIYLTTCFIEESMLIPENIMVAFYPAKSDKYSGDMHGNLVTQEYIQNEIEHPEKNIYDIDCQYDKWAAYEKRLEDEQDELTKAATNVFSPDQYVARVAAFMLLVKKQSNKGKNRFDCHKLNGLRYWP